MSHISPLFPASRVKRELIVQDYGSPTAVGQIVTRVTGADGVEREVQRTRILTGIQIEAAKRLGALIVVPR